MALSDLQVFSEYAYSSMTEVLSQQVALFNAASRGTLVLSSAAHQGDFSDAAMWAKISGLVRRRNVYGSGSVTEKHLQHLLETSVKVAAGTPPIRIDPSFLRWIQRSPEEAGVVIGKQLAGDTLADMLNAAARVGVTALTNVTAVTTDVTATAGDAGKTNIANLNKAVSKFGDQAQKIVAWLMHSTPLFDIYGQAITNANQLFMFDTVQVRQDGFGRVFVITDSPALKQVDGVSAGVDAYVSLGLIPSAIRIDQNGDYTDNTETKNGNENIQRTWQAEWTYNVGIQGFAWDKVSGGKSPNDSAIGAAGNWDRYATSDKDLAGVALRTK